MSRFNDVCRKGCDKKDICTPPLGVSFRALTFCETLLVSWLARLAVLIFMELIKTNCKGQNKTRL